MWGTCYRHVRVRMPDPENSIFAVFFLLRRHPHGKHSRRGGDTATSSPPCDSSEAARGVCVCLPCREPEGTRVPSRPFPSLHAGHLLHRVRRVPSSLSGAGSTQDRAEVHGLPGERSGRRSLGCGRVRPSQPCCPLCRAHCTGNDTRTRILSVCRGEAPGVPHSILVLLTRLGPTWTLPVRAGQCCTPKRS